MAGIKLILCINGRECRTATVRYAGHLKVICRRWLAGHSDRSIRAEIGRCSMGEPFGKTMTTPLAHSPDTVADIIRVWATKCGWQPETRRGLANLGGAVKLSWWPTPTTNDDRAPSDSACIGWPTPTCNTNPQPETRRGLANLGGAEKLSWWPTPTTNDDRAPSVDRALNTYRQDGTKIQKRLQDLAASLGKRVAQLSGKALNDLHGFTNAALVREMGRIAAVERGKVYTPQTACNMADYDFVIVYGPYGCGKTTNRFPIAAYYKMEHIKDDPHKWSNPMLAASKTLYLCVELDYDFIGRAIVGGKRVLIIPYDKLPRGAVYSEAKS
jgi:hypothetical protein